MSDKKIKPKIKDLNSQIMSQIKSGKIKMKPKWYFVAGSILMFASLVGVTITSIFLLNLIFFLIRKQGSGQHRLELMLTSFPWWIILVAIAFLISAIILLRKYDFSYRKNFKAIIFGFILVIILSAWLVDYVGLNDIWARGPMRHFYQNISGENNYIKQGRGKRLSN